MTKLCWFLCSYKFVINSCEYFCIKKRRRCNYIAAFLVNRIRYLLIARMLRLIRLLIHVRRCRAFIATFLTLIPSLMPYLGTLFCVMCVYCSLGVQVTQSSLPLLVFCSKSFTICLYNFWYILYTKSNFVRIKVGRWVVWYQGCSRIVPGFDSPRIPGWGGVCVFWRFIQKEVILYV